MNTYDTYERRIQGRRFGESQLGRTTAATERLTASPGTVLVGFRFSSPGSRVVKLIIRLRNGSAPATRLDLVGSVRPD